MEREDTMSPTQALMELLEAQTKLLGRRPEYLEVNPEIYAAALSDIHSFVPYGYPEPRPKAPVKRTEQTSNISLWRTRTSEAWEFDHHAPAYLEELKAWQERKEKWEKERDCRKGQPEILYFAGVEIRCKS